MNTVFLRVLEADDKAAALRRIIGQSHALQGEQYFEVDVADFAAIPKSPFAYWVSERIRQLFVNLLPFQADGRLAAIGASTKDDGRFVRAAWEVQQDGSNVPFAKGGGFRPFFDDIHLLIRWNHNGAEAKAFVSEYRRAHGWSPHWKAELHNPDLYFRPGLTWPRRTQRGLSLRVMPAGCIFADKGPAAFVEDDCGEDLLALLAISSSRAFCALVDLQMAFGSYEVGVIQRTPIPRVVASDRAKLSAFARSGWSLERSLDTQAETSHGFVLPALLLVGGETLAMRARAWAERVAGVEAELERVQSEIDELCFELYGISGPDRRTIVEGLNASSGSSEEGGTAGEDADDAAEGMIELDPRELAAGLVSWAVGVAMGRFDTRLATGTQPWQQEPDPFDPLPTCSPGMLAGRDGLPLAVPPESYPVDVSSILVDDPGHLLDITRRVRSVFDVVFGEDADRWWADVGMTLRVKGGELGGWLSKGLFDHQLKTYSKSRRKAPILWPIGTRSGSYIVWLYAHRVSSDSLFQILNDIVAPKVQVEERELTQRRQDAGADPTSSQRKTIDTQEHFVAELHEFCEELEAIAPLWAPYLNDGIVIVLAPLWRLFAHQRAWSSELKRHWAKLAKGDYDWAQFAMRLWPARVVPKCAEDRSLAIAHGLEDVFWMQDPDNGDKWLPRQIPIMPIEQLVTERHNPATSAALQWVNT